VTLTKISLNYLKTEQIPQVVELDQLYLGGIWSKNAYKTEIESPNSTVLALFLPHSDDTIIGYGCLWSILEEAHITILLVHPRYQGQGLGQLLLLSLLEDALKRGLERATLEVRAGNQVAISLYEKFGFKIAGRRKNYYAATGEDALILWRSQLHYPEFKQELTDWREKIVSKIAQHNWQYYD
jgi:[ribosomal protein S18]-alanine N-acetyltransferase